MIYDARRAPEVERWLAMEEVERIAEVRRFHVTPPLPHPIPPSLDAHIIMHTVIETQLARGEPAEAKRALGRLLSDGLGRHDAIHALGTALASSIWEMSQDEPKEFDLEGYKGALAELDQARWRELVDGTPAPPRKKKAATKKKRRR